MAVDGPSPAPAQTAPHLPVVAPCGERRPVRTGDTGWGRSDGI